MTKIRCTAPLDSINDSCLIVIEPIVELVTTGFDMPRSAIFTRETLARSTLVGLRPRCAMSRSCRCTAHSIKLQMELSSFSVSISPANTELPGNCSIHACKEPNEAYSIEMTATEAPTDAFTIFASPGNTKPYGN